VKTTVFDTMPRTFWQEVVKNGLSKYFAKKVDYSSEIAVLRTKTQFNKEIFDKMPNLKLIIRSGSGFDNIDIHTAQKRKIIVCNTPKSNSFAAHEHTISLIFALIKNIQVGKSAIQNKRWKKGLIENLSMKDLRVLVVGVGRVGSMVAKTLMYLGAQVKGVDPYLRDIEKRTFNFGFSSYSKGIQWCNLITFHCPLFAETRSYFDQETLDKLGASIYLVNVARGGIVDQSIILKGLETGKLLGVALDVFEIEPCKKLDFANFDNVYLTPHTGAYTYIAKKKMCQETIQTWKKFVFEKKIVNEIDYRFID